MTGGDGFSCFLSEFRFTVQGLPFTNSKEILSVSEESDSQQQQEKGGAGHCGACRVFDHK